jgi:hypothetical protein
MHTNGSGYFQQAFFVLFCFVLARHRVCETAGESGFNIFFPPIRDESFFPRKRICDRVAIFFLVQYTKTGKKYQITRIYTKRPQNIPNGRKIDEMAIKYTNIFFHCKSLQNLPKLIFLVRKSAIWQPGSATRFDFPIIFQSCPEQNRLKNSICSSVTARD